jgi:hypothetical protein
MSEVTYSVKIMGSAANIALGRVQIARLTSSSDGGAVLLLNRDPHESSALKA